MPVAMSVTDDCSQGVRQVIFLKATICTPSTAGQLLRGRGDAPDRFRQIFIGLGVSRFRKPSSKQLGEPETEMLGNGRHDLKSRYKAGEPNSYSGMYE